MKPDTKFESKTNYHTSILVGEIQRFLCTAEPVEIADFTLGGGGHLESLLQCCTSVKKAIGFDQDKEALQFASDRLKNFQNVEFVHKNFRKIKAADYSFDRIVADLGVSSWQLDEGRRGFSFQKEGPLDMRMDQSSGQSASELLMQCSKEELEKVVFDYGEDPQGKVWVKRWMQARPNFKNSPLTTQAFVEALGLKADSKNPMGRHPLTKLFQSLRIWVNDEFGALDDLLSELPSLLKQNARVAIITFHSLEDRRVKWGLKGRLKPLNKKVIEAGDDERNSNPRSRSAKLRVYEKE